MSFAKHNSPPQSRRQLSPLMPLMLLVTTFFLSGCLGSEEACDNSCQYAYDGACDDGGPNADFSICDCGTDCADCGKREKTRNACLDAGGSGGNSGAGGSSGGTGGSGSGSGGAGGPVNPDYYDLLIGCLELAPAHCPNTSFTVRVYEGKLYRNSWEEPNIGTFQFDDDDVIDVGINCDWMPRRGTSGTYYLEDLEIGEDYTIMCRYLKNNCATTTTARNWVRVEEYDDCMNEIGYEVRDAL